MTPAYGLLQVYDSSARIQLNDVVEVLGVISHAPELAQFGFAAGAAAPDGLGLSTVLEDDELAAHPPTSRVREGRNPRLVLLR